MGRSRGSHATSSWALAAEVPACKSRISVELFESDAERADVLNERILRPAFPR